MLEIYKRRSNIWNCIDSGETAQKLGNLTQGGIGGELLGSAIDAIGQTTGIDVSGVAGVAFPKGGGGGGGFLRHSYSRWTVGAEN